jgi:hypothetical protein
MVDKSRPSLADGTLVRHKTKGYEGKIEGITGIKACFTREGIPSPPSLNKEPFQYRIVVRGESMRRIAPAEDLEVIPELTDKAPPKQPKPPVGNKIAKERKSKKLSSAKS